MPGAKTADTQFGPESLLWIVVVVLYDYFGFMFARAMAPSHKTEFFIIYTMIAIIAAIVTLFVRTWPWMRYSLQISLAGMIIVTAGLSDVFSIKSVNRQLAPAIGDTSGASTSASPRAPSAAAGSAASVSSHGSQGPANAPDIARSDLPTISLVGESGDDKRWAASIEQSAASDLRVPGSAAITIRGTVTAQDTPPPIRVQVNWSIGSTDGWADCGSTGFSGFDATLAAAQFADTFRRAATQTLSSGHLSCR